MSAFFRMYFVDLTQSRKRCEAAERDKSLACNRYMSNKIMCKVKWSKR